MRRLFYNRFITALIIISFGTSGCTKFTEIDPPKGQLIGAAAFNSDSSALAAILGIYQTMNTTAVGFGYQSQYMGLSADELIKFNPTDEMMQIQANQLTATNRTIAQLWSGAYDVIGRANSCIENLAISTALNAEFKSKLDGEARFLRAFSYFYLVNQYGDLPLVINTNWRKAQTIVRSPIKEVYELIKSDLRTARQNLGNDKKIRASKLAATALLARVYLYNEQFDSAYILSNQVIGDPEMPEQLPELDEVFLIGSTEAIFQLETSQMMRFVNEAISFIPPPFPGASPGYALTDLLLDAFEPGDLRKLAWLKTVDYGGKTYYYPYKYKSVGMPTEYYVLLRLTEQILIRSEAAVQMSSPNLTSALKGLNIIRTRAGLPDLPENLSKNALLAAILKERRTELFVELGHRWLDLKRTSKADAVLKEIKTD